MSLEPHSPEEKWKKENKPTEGHHSEWSLWSTPALQPEGSFQSLNPNVRFPNVNPPWFKALQQLPTVLGIKFASLTWSPRRTHNVRSLPMTHPRWRHLTTVFLPRGSLLSISLTCPVPLYPRALHIFPNLHLLSILPVDSSLGVAFFSVNSPWPPDLFVISWHCVMALCHLQYFTKLASTDLNIIWPSPVSPMKFWVPYGQGMVCFCSLSTPSHQVWHLA